MPVPVFLPLSLPLSHSHSLSLPPHPCLPTVKVLLSAYFVLSFWSAFPFLPRTATRGINRNMAQKTEDSLQQKCLALQHRNDLVMWQLADKSLFCESDQNSTEFHEGLPITLGQLGSGLWWTSGGSLFISAWAIPPFIQYHFLKWLRKV